MFLTKFATQGPPAPPARHVPGVARSCSDRALANPKIEIHWNTAVDEVLGDEKVEGLRWCETRSPASSREMPVDGPVRRHRPRAQHRRCSRDWLDMDDEGLPRRPATRPASDDRRRVHRRRRPGPQLPAGRHRRRRRLQGRHRRRALARGAGHHRSRDRHRLVRRRITTCPDLLAAPAMHVRGWSAFRARRTGPRPAVRRWRVWRRPPRRIRAGPQGAAGPADASAGSSALLRALPVPGRRSSSVAILATSLIGLINPSCSKLLIDDVIIGEDYTSSTCTSG